MITFFFMSCKYLDMFWNKINEMLNKSNLKTISDFNV